jgi:RND family efflux transporter MFP subunit
MKKIVWTLILVAAVGGLAWQIYRRHQESQASSRRDRPGGRGVTVAVTPVRRATLYEESEFTGTLVARSRFVLAPKVSGRLVRLTADMGDEVRRGDLVAVLDSAEYAQQVAQAQAELDVARAVLEEAESGREVAQNDLKRIADLHGERVASDAQLDEARARHRAMEARAQVARAQIRQREAALESARTRLDYTQLRADWDGTNETRRIAERFADEGSMLRANDPVVSVVDTRTLVAVVHVIERDFPSIAPGLPAMVRVDAFPDDRFAGRITRRAPTLDEQSRHARVEIEVDNPGHRLAPGMFARVVVRFSERKNVQVVPVAALTVHNGRRGVFLADTNTMTARFTALATGIVDGDRVEVPAPEIAGSVITLGQHLLEDGGAIMLPARPGADANSAEQDRPRNEERP